MGRLDKACGYLSGPMEFVSDHGVTWRRKFTKLVYEAGLDIDLIDPTDKPCGIDSHIGENQEYQRMLQETGQFKVLQQYVRKYRRYDLRSADNCDFIVAVVDPTIPQWGTGNEIYVAEDQHKPTFFIIEGGLKKLPRWLFGVIERIESYDPLIAERESNVFQSVEEVVEQLVLRDNGTIPLTEEWVLIRKFIEDRRVLRNRYRE